MAGVKAGPWKFFHHDGKTLKAAGKFAGGLFSGMWRWYGANGDVRQAGAFADGKQHGQWKRYYAGTRQLCDVGRYHAGKRAGVWKFYDRAGKLKRQETFAAAKKRSPPTRSKR